MENWKPVVGHKDAYEISDLGRVRSLDREWTQLSKWGTSYTYRKKGKLLRPGRCGGGHVSIAVGRNNSICVHVLVLEAFVGPAPKGHECRHLNGFPDENRLTNLEWNTRGRNIQDKKYHNGQRTYKLSTAQVLEIKALLQERKLTQTAIAELFNVCNSTVSSIKSGVFHKDVTL